jgi:hypothetical protein
MPRPTLPAWPRPAGASNARGTRHTRAPAAGHGRVSSPQNAAAAQRRRRRPQTGANERRPLVMWPPMLGHDEAAAAKRDPNNDRPPRNARGPLDCSPGAAGDLSIVLDKKTFNFQLPLAIAAASCRRTGGRAAAALIVLARAPCVCRAERWRRAKGASRRSSLEGGSRWWWPAAGGA